MSTAFSRAHCIRSMQLPIRRTCQCSIIMTVALKVYAAVSVVLASRYYGVDESSSGLAGYAGLL